MAQQNDATIEGTTTENTTGPYGETGCDETMHVIHDGEDIYVPLNGVRASGYDFHGEVPDKFDVDRIVEYNDRIHAEADVDGGVVELQPNYNSATTEFKGYDSWTLQLFDADAPTDSKVVWERNMGERQDANANDEPTVNHDASDIDVITIDPDDVVEAMRRNKRDRDQRRTHTLRVTPPLSGEKRATPYVSEDHSFYPSEAEETPIHISPEAFLVGHAAGYYYPAWRGEWSHPDHTEEMGLFRDEYDIHDRELTDEERDRFDDWFDVAVEVWEGGIRHTLDNGSGELTLTSPDPDVDDTTVIVRLETASEEEREGRQ